MKQSYDVVRQPKGLVILSFVMLLALMIARVALAPYPAETSAVPDMPLGKLIDKLTDWSAILTCIIGALLIFTNAMLITRLIDRYYVSYVPTYLPLVMFLLTAYGICIPVWSISASIGPLLLILSAEEIIASFQRTHTFRRTLSSAFFLGLIPMIYSPAIVLVAILPATLLIYRRSGREAIVALVGLLLPFTLCTIGWWFAGYEWGFIAQSLASGITAPAGYGIRDTLTQTGIPTIVYVGLYTILLGYSIVLTILYFPRMHTRAKKIYIHFILLLLVTITMFLIPSSNIFNLCFLAVPGSLVSTVFFIHYQKFASFIVYIVLIGLVVTINLIPIFGLF